MHRLLSLLSPLLLYSVLLCSVFAGAVRAQPAEAIGAMQITAQGWQSIPHGQARFVQWQSAATPYTHGIEVRLAPDWHTYWQNPGDSGAPPDLFAASGDEQTQLEIAYPRPIRIDFGPLTTYGYEGAVMYFFQPRADAPVLRADLLVCKEECIPGSVDVDLAELEPVQGAQSETTADFVLAQLAALPLPAGQGATPINADYEHGSTRSEWRVELDKPGKLIDLFWYAGQVNDLAELQWFSPQQRVFKFYQPLSFSNQANPRALLVFQRGDQTHSAVVTFDEQAPSMAAYFVMAMFGGFILNFMPCVFPVVSLKAFAIVTSSGKALRQIRIEQSLYCLGVIVSFVVLGLALAFVRAAGAQIGWGFQLQNTWVVLGLAGLFIVLGLAFFDVWHFKSIAVTDRLTNEPQQSKGLAAFMTGLLAVVVASPCTAPFMGAAIGFAMSQSSFAISIIFLGLGLGMCLPFAIMAVAPQVSRFLPKPGPWLVWFKKIMGACLMLTAIWLCWLAWQLQAVKPSSDNAAWHSIAVSEWDDVIGQSDQARFVNFTADWCVSCKANELVVFDTEKVMRYFSQHNVKLFKVDWTKREPAIADKLAQFGRIGVPLYLFYPAGSQVPIVLPEVLTKDLLLERLESAK